VEDSAARLAAISASAKRKAVMMGSATAGSFMAPTLVAVL
jgi:hypothetical protein